MPITENWSRPLANPNSTEALALTAAVVEDAANKRIIINLFATIGSSPKLIQRIVLPIEIHENILRVGAIHYVFPGGAANYVAGVATPALDAAVNYEEPESAWGPPIDLNAFYTAAGDAQS